MTAQQIDAGAAAAAECGPWNPGIESQVPAEILHLATVFRPENVFTSLAGAMELKGLTGFALSELVAFRPQRLALHELLIRITADFVVPDGSRIEDLGINFREIARRLLANAVIPHMDALVGAFERARSALGAAIDAAWAAMLCGPAQPPATGDRVSGSRLFARWLSARAHAAAPAGRGWGPPQIAELERLAGAADDPLRAAACRALGRVLSALFTVHGQAWGSRDLIVALATDIASNGFGSEVIGRTLDPLLRSAALREGYCLLPRQERPIVINTKGASASGKSTLRPLQKQLAHDIGVRWEDFALISPDIWRKQLLDYGSLGTAYKYAGAFTADELQIVDQKLDRYMARKHRRGEMSHLLIDRFRFDSFAPDSDEAGSNLLTRFGHTVYLFFVITPPELLVERAWKRGLEVGRYKAVDDTLAHAVEAYTGIPDVFFTWVRRSDKRIRFEFLDNTVQFGERPRIVAFGDNTTFNVIDVANMLNIERFGQVNVNASTPASLYFQGNQQDAQRNSKFLRRCIEAFGTVTFLEQSTGIIYLRIESGIPVWKHPAMLHKVLSNPATRAALHDIAPDALLARAADAGVPQYLTAAPDGAELRTVGQWAMRR